MSRANIAMVGEFLNCVNKVGLDILLNIALVLGCLDEFDALLSEEPKPTDLFQEENTPRQRGRLK